MLLAWLLLGALAGVFADWTAARVTDKPLTPTSSAIGALVGAALAVIVVAHPLHGWHGRLLPVWLWGWFVAADADLRAQELYDIHTVGLLALALIAGIEDRQGLVAITGAAVMGGVWAVVRGGLRWWTWRTSATLALASAAVLLVGLREVALARQSLAAGGSLAIVQQSASDLIGSARAAVVGGFGITLAPLLAWVGAISRRAHDGEAVVGGADMFLWAATGAWFGLRWVWPIAAATIAVLGLAALAQLAARTAGWRPPWAADHLPVAPIIFLVLAIAS